MKRLLYLALVLAACLCTNARAGQNAGAHAWLTWSATDNSVTDLSNPGPASILYVRFTEVAEFKGAGVDIIWDPPGDSTSCFTHTGTSFPTSTGTTCTYLNRGGSLPQVLADGPGVYHVVWMTASCNTSCSAGAAIAIQFAFDGCQDPTGCFGLTYALLFDCSGAQDFVTVSGAEVTVDGGGTHHCSNVPVLPSTWGGIKALYHRE